MKKLILIILILLIAASAFGALIRNARISGGRISNVASTGSGSTHYLLIDGSGHSLFIDGSDNQFRIDGSE